MCEFCQELEDVRWYHAEETNPKIRHIQTVALIDESYRWHLFSGRVIHFGDKFKLNFCPMCGKKLEDNKGVKEDENC